jgi:N utilization substance protein A
MNLADVEWVVQYRISDAKNFLFKVRNPDETLRDISESAMRQIVGDRTVNEVLTVGSAEIASEAEVLIQDLCTEYEIGIKIDTSQLDRIADQTAKQVIIQNNKEAQRENVYSDYKDKQGELVTGFVHRFEKGSIIVMLGRYEALLPTQEQIPGEMFSLRDRIKGFVLDVKRNAKGPQIIVSRTHPGFLLKLFAIDVPEIA